MARILTKAQLSKLESKSQAELLAIVLDLATHLPLAKKHLINQYLTAEDALLALAKKEYSKLTRRPPSWVRIPVKLNSDSGICEHHFRKVCGQGFFEQKLSFEGRHLFDSLNKPAAKRSAAVVDPRRWNRTVHLTSEYVH